MKLRCHTIVRGGRYFKAGEQVPDELMSPAIARKYAVSEGDRDAPPISGPTKTKRKYGAAKFKNLK